MQIPVFAIRLLRLSSLDSHELEQSSIPVAKGKAMFPNSSIIDTLEQMTESEEQFLDHPRLVLRLRRSENSAIRKIWNKGQRTQSAPSAQRGSKDNIPAPIHDGAPAQISAHEEAYIDCQL